MPSNGFADWGKEPVYAEINRYSKISIGFASQDLKSPISNFGHTFLIFHNSDPPEADSLAVEFTGEAPDILANISALFTSVPGKYSLSYLTEKIREYDYENRSIWLYKLGLSTEALEALKLYLLKSEKTNFAYDFSQKNCSFYIAQAIAHSRSVLEYKRDGLFVTPVSTLRWARSEGILSSEIFLPSTQLKALNEYEALSDSDQKITRDYLNHSNVPNSGGTNSEIGKSLSAIAEYMIPREADSSNRNYLFSIKRDFPSSSGSRVLAADDPSRSTGPNSISMLLLPNRNASIFTISPGFIRLENETASGQNNSTIEALRTDIFADTAGYIRLEEFHLVRTESNQPSGYLRDGFTQAFDISYTDYRTYLDKNYKEAKILFGRGVSWLYGGNTISLLPLVSVIDSWRESGTDASGRIELRLKDYKQLNEHFIAAVQIDQTINQHSEIRQTINFDLLRSIKKNFSISFNIHRVKGKQQTSTLTGFSINASF